MSRDVRARKQLSLDRMVAEEHFMVELPLTVLHAIDEVGPEPVRAYDPRNQEQYVLLPAAMYQQIQNALDDAIHPEEVGLLIADGMQEYDENDPLLDSYQVYRQ